MRAVLDTSVLLADSVPPIDGEVAISAASLAELHVGVLLASDAAVRARRLRRLAFLERTFDALPVDGSVAASYGRLAAAMVAGGQKPRARVMDLLIAATAHAHGACVYTRNEAAFAALAGLVDIVVT